LSQYTITSFFCLSTLSRLSFVSVHYHVFLLFQYTITSFFCLSTLSRISFVSVHYHVFLLSQYTITYVAYCKMMIKIICIVDELNNWNLKLNSLNTSSFLFLTNVGHNYLSRITSFAQSNLSCMFYFIFGYKSDFQTDTESYPFLETMCICIVWLFCHFVNCFKWFI